MIKQAVHSENGGNEGRWVLFTISVILLCGMFFLPYNTLKSTPIPQQAHQIAVTDIESKERAIIADLRLAHEEIRNLYDDSMISEKSPSWPLPSALEALWIAPFIKDKSWQQQGQHVWQQIAPAVYQGLPRSGTAAAAYLLFSEASHPEIWRHASPASSAVTNSKHAFSIQQLIAAGWSQIVFADSPHLTAKH